MTLTGVTWASHMDGWSFGGWIAMVVGMVLFWALVIVGVVWLIRTAPWAPGERHKPDSAIEVLDRRFAAGEISVEEYRERRAILRGENFGDHQESSGGAGGRSMSTHNPDAAVTQATRPIAPP